MTKRAKLTVEHVLSQLDSGFDMRLLSTGFLKEVLQARPEQADALLAEWVGDRDAVDEDLDLSGCDGLKALPEGLKQVNKSVYLNDCSSLVSLGGLSRVGESLDLSGCERLETLSGTLYVYDLLDVSCCPNLRSLPTKLTCKVLDLSGCERLKELPVDLHVEDNMRVEGCPLSKRAREIVERLDCEVYD